MTPCQNASPLYPDGIHYCVLPANHDGFHQSSHGEVWRDATSKADARTAHKAAVMAGARELSDFVNELPSGFYHMTPDDAELAARRVIEAYRVALERQQ